MELRSLASSLRRARGNLRRTAGEIFLIPASSSSSSTPALSVVGRYSINSALSSILRTSWSQGNRASLRAMRSRARVPSRRTRSAPSAGTMRVWYAPANFSSTSTLEGGHPVRSRSAASSERPMGCAGTGKNMFACSVESQSRSGAARDAVLTTRKQGWAAERSGLI
jgi:hypothetical protein